MPLFFYVKITFWAEEGYHYNVNLTLPDPSQFINTNPPHPYSDLELCRFPSLPTPLVGGGKFGDRLVSGFFRGFFLVKILPSAPCSMYHKSVTIRVWRGWITVANCKKILNRSCALCRPRVWCRGQCMESWKQANQSRLQVHCFYLFL